MNQTTNSTPNTPPEAAAAKEVASRPVRHWRARLFQGYLVTAVIAFAVLVVLASQFSYFSIDLAVTRQLQLVSARWFSGPMLVVSYAGYSPQAYILVVIVAALIFVMGLRWEAVMSAIAAFGGATLVQVVKVLVHRPRPGADLVQVSAALDSYSFPSGHVVFYVAFFGFLLFLAFTLFKPSGMRTLVLLVTAILILLIGPSRIYLGNHWASDVTGAYLLGSLWLSACVSLYRWGKPRFFTQQPVAPAEAQSASHA